jgi:hypothetical protein
MTTTLVNSIVDLSVSDPWEFGTECGEGPFRGRVVDVAEGALAVRLEAPLQYRGKTLVAAIVRPRHGGESTEVLKQTRRLVANFLFLTRDVSSLGALRRSEDGVAAIGSARAQ